LKRRKTIKKPKEIQKKHHSTQEYQPNNQKTEMSTSASTQTVLTVVKDEFTEVLTEGTLSPTTKPANWNVVITEKALLDAMKTPSPPPEETQ
jgi:hypothetical protein